MQRRGIVKSFHAIISSGLPLLRIRDSPLSSHIPFHASSSRSSFPKKFLVVNIFKRTLSPLEKSTSEPDSSDVIRKLLFFNPPEISHCSISPLRSPQKRNPPRTLRVAVRQWPSCNQQPLTGDGVTTFGRRVELWPFSVSFSILPAVSAEAERFLVDFLYFIFSLRRAAET